MNPDNSNGKGSAQPLQPVNNSDNQETPKSQNTPERKENDRLFAAIHNNQPERVKESVKAGANPNVHRKKGGVTPLIMTIDHSKLSEESKLTIVKLLLDLKNEDGTPKVDINAKADNGNTALHYAVMKKNLDIVELLLKNKANPNIKNNKKLTPLDLAEGHFFEKIKKLLLQNGAEVTDESYKALKKIKDETKKDAVKRILNDVVSLFKAISANEKEEVDKLIQAGVSLNARSKDGWTPLMVAIVDDYENAGSEQKPETDTNLVKARKLEIINLLLEQKNEDGTLKFDINAKTKLYKNTALHFAVRTGDKDIVELLIKNGAEVNSELSTGHTPLMLAVRSGNEEIVKLLLQNGAKINLKNKNGHTPLMLAVRSGNEAIVNLLLQNGAEVTDESYKALKKIKDETKKDAVKKILDDKAVEAKKS